jgi:hypothetical protein
MHDAAFEVTLVVASKNFPFAAVPPSSNKTPGNPLIAETLYFG